MVGGLGATVVGTPAQVAIEFERWVEEADVDGFNIVREKTERMSTGYTDTYNRPMPSLPVLSTT